MNLIKRASGIFSTQADSEPKLQVKCEKNFANADDFITPLCTIRVDAEEYERLRNQEQDIDINTLTKEEIDRLRTSDPFMFYSIPESQRTSNCHPIPAPPKRRRVRISRHTAISVEAHPSLIFEELLNNDNDVAMRQLVDHKRANRRVGSRS